MFPSKGIPGGWGIGVVIAISGAQSARVMGNVEKYSFEWRGEERGKSG